MKKILSTAIALCVLFSVTAQAPSEEGYRFTDTKVIPTTAVRDQSRSGTCWCFSTMSFLESEILRAGGDAVDLADMWIVRNVYFEKAVKYVRLHGHLNLAVGGQSRDVTAGIVRYGIVPEEVYPGLNYGTQKPHFDEIDAVVKAYADAVIKSAARSKLTTAWQAGLTGILDAYFGVMPEKFTYKGKEYTPHTFAASLPVKMDDYIEFSSFTHHPYYEQFVPEVPDNWSWGSVWNLPLAEMMDVIDRAVAEGYTVAWGTDVSEKGFSRVKAIGIIPEADLEGMQGTEAERWGQLSPQEREAELYKFDKPGKERTITEQLRQEAYDNYETTDDHGMLIMGMAVDQQGNLYYKVQNSWDVRPPYDGFYYFSPAFVAYKTISIMVNKNAVPKEILGKLK